ncbi:hypothetical protein PtA15_1A891 [Puccinia triticina]|uniref:RecA family profile 1 domain-containing protein n=1 Tax=Puccinia triticina TaxID=208348 RepID=A0ABY7CA42_9BASI|nr:uncharacterized protein PtA15_1A891 [Puccinia triticina]WAQ81549.1 hypothetical protein PtA15_1A891 [Puccinia triticina]
MPKEGSPARPIKLIILDSIGVIFRADLEQLKQSSAKFRMTERAAEMNQVADGLKVLADQYRLTVVVVNQVSDVMAPPSFSSELALPRPHNTIVVCGRRSDLYFLTDPPVCPRTVRFPSALMDLGTPTVPSSHTINPFYARY